MKEVISFLLLCFLVSTPSIAATADDTTVRKSESIKDSNSCIQLHKELFFHPGKSEILVVKFKKTRSVQAAITNLTPESSSDTVHFVIFWEKSADEAKLSFEKRKKGLLKTKSSKYLPTSDKDTYCIVYNGMRSYSLSERFPTAACVKLLPYGVVDFQLPYYSEKDSLSESISKHIRSAPCEHPIDARLE